MFHSIGKIELDGQIETTLEALEHLPKTRVLLG